MRAQPGLAVVVAVFAVAVVTTSPAAGQQEPPIQSAAVVVSPAPWIDRVYDRITRFFNARVRAVDSYFAQHEPVDADEESQLRVRLWLQHEDGELDFKPVVSTNLQMPNLERRLDLYVENITQNLLPGSDPVESDTRLRVGARGDLFRGGRWAVTRDLGVGFSGGVKLYAQVAGHYRWYWGHWEGVASQSVFWNRDDELGGLSRVVLDRTLAPAWYLRLQSAAKYTQEQEYWRTSQVAKVAWVIEEQRHYLLASAAVFGKSRVVDEYRSELSYRTRMWRPWIYAELTPYLSFRREKSFESSPGVRIGLDLFFGGTPRL